MISSQKDNTLFSIYKNNRTVYNKNSISLLTSESEMEKLYSKLNYYVKTGKLLNPRKGIYAKLEYDPDELACTLYTPSYISLEYVLQKAGVIFQYNEQITSVSYLSRELVIDKRTYRYRKVKNDILICFDGIKRIENVNIATPERAFLDILYLNSDYYFDNLNSLNKELVFKYLEIYKSKKLSKRVKSLLE